MLIPSGNNIASLLARWEAGSQAAFVAKMNAAAGPLGLGSTRYADASGADPATAGTAAGPCPAALGSLVARSQIHLCPGSHGYMFAARAQG
jgi:D-alanyl-D-alanine carboxypeptidase-like protein